MEADFSIELGHDDPVLDFPWSDPAGKLCYSDLKRHPELISRLDEPSLFPELTSFLRAVNSRISMVESAKCDVWSTTELSPEEDVFSARHKFACYVDLVFSNLQQRQSFAFHEHFAKGLVELLRRAPYTRSAVEVCVRRCYFQEDSETREGLYFTFYVNGYGEDEGQARQNWGIALKLAGNAMIQLSAADAG